MTAIERLMKLRHSLPRIQVGYGFPNVAITYSPPQSVRGHGWWVVTKQVAYHRAWKRDSAHQTLELAATRAIQLRKEGAKRDYCGVP